MKESVAYYSDYEVGEMCPENGYADDALDDVMEWLGFTLDAEYAEYAVALEDEKEKIFLRAKD